MRLAALLITSFLVCFITSPSLAQLPPLKSDPLSKSSSAQACSATEASCAEAAAKILPLVMGPSPMEENLRRLTDEVGGRVTGSPEMAKAVEWARRRISCRGHRRAHRKVHAARRPGAKATPVSNSSAPPNFRYVSCRLAGRPQRPQAASRPTCSISVTAAHDDFARAGAP